MTPPLRPSRLALRTFDVDRGDDVFPGHCLVVRGWRITGTPATT